MCGLATLGLLSCLAALDKITEVFAPSMCDQKSSWFHPLPCPPLDSLYFDMQMPGPWYPTRAGGVDGDPRPSVFVQRAEVRSSGLVAHHPTVMEHADDVQHGKRESREVTNVRECAWMHAAWHSSGRQLQRLPGKAGRQADGELDTFQVGGALGTRNVAGRGQPGMNDVLCGDVAGKKEGAKKKKNCLVVYGVPSFGFQA